MKKIGFIDYYLDEWHANNYPQMIRNLSNETFQVCYAYGMIDSPDRLTNQQWAEKYQIALCDTIEEVIEKSDYIIVLSPDHPEMHETLAKLPLSSGKLVYIDKTFAPDRETAVRIFKAAEQGNTLCYSCSALAFATELQALSENDISVVESWGPGIYENYSIHQIEMIVSLLGTKAQKVMAIGNANHESLVITFEGGKQAQLSQFRNGPFTLNVGYSDGSTKHVEIKSDYFGEFIKGLIRYFETGIIPVSHEQTVAVIAIRQAGKKALQHPFTWIEVK